MKRHHHLHKDKSSALDEPKLDISSLIDVCFLLLIYFLVTTTIQPREQDLSTYVPSRSGESLATIQPMVIEIRQGGEVVVNPGDAAETYDSDGSKRTLPQLESRLSMLSGWRAPDSTKILLKVHDEVYQQRYIDVVNCLAGAGITSIALVE